MSDDGRQDARDPEEERRDPGEAAGGAQQRLPLEQIQIFARGRVLRIYDDEDADVARRRPERCAQQGSRIHSRPLIGALVGACLGVRHGSQRSSLDVTWTQFGSFPSARTLPPISTTSRKPAPVALTRSSMRVEITGAIRKAYKPWRILRSVAFCTAS